MKIASMLVSLLFVAAAAASAAAQTAPTARRIIVTPHVDLPEAAKETGLGGMVSVGITVDSYGNVVSVGSVVGPGSVCPSATRADVIALREAAKTAALTAKFAPTIDTNVTEMSIDFDFPIAKNPTAAGSEDRLFTAADTASAPAVIGDRSAKRPLQINGGVLNGKAISLPKPAYPPAARAVRASGTVSVEVVIDEEGKIFSAEVVSGHPLLRAASRTAACEAQFSQTRLSGNPVKVAGIISYQFVP